MSKSITITNDSVRRIVPVLGLTVLMLTVAVGVVAAGPLVEDFEDGTKGNITDSTDETDVVSGGPGSSNWTLEHQNKVGGSIPQYSVSSPNTVSMDIKGTSNGRSVMILESSNGGVFRIEINKNGYLYVNNNNVSTRPGTATWYRGVMTDIDYTNQTGTVRLIGQNGNVVYENSSVPFQRSSTSSSSLLHNGNAGARSDNWRVGGTGTEGFPAEIKGTVTDQVNNPVAGATVELKNSTGVVNSTTTNGVGEYNLTVSSGGDYNVTVSQDPFLNKTKPTTLSLGNTTTLDFTLEYQSARIRFDTPRYMKHGEDSPYSVSVRENGTWNDVTSSATVTSTNVTVITVDSSTQTLNATSNVNINNRVRITAQYTDSNGKTLTADEQVAVANNSVSNFDILPPAWQVNATMNDSGIQIILVALLLAVAATLFSTSFAGLSIGTLTIIVGWLGGWADTGLVLTAIALAAFIGLNLAANIDYSVRTG